MTNVEVVVNSKYAQELTETLAQHQGTPVYFYRLHDLLIEAGEETTQSPQYGEPEFVVSKKRLTKQQVKKIVTRVDVKTAFGIL